MRPGLYPVCFSIQLENYFICKDPHLPTSSYKSEFSTACSSPNSTGVYRQSHLFYIRFLWQKKNYYLYFLSVFLTRVGPCTHKTISKQRLVAQWTRSAHAFLNFTQKQPALTSEQGTQLRLRQYMPLVPPLFYNFYLYCQRHMQLGIYGSEKS